MGDQGKRAGIPLLFCGLYQSEKSLKAEILVCDGFNNTAKAKAAMPTAYVLINCDLGSEEEIIKELKKLPEAIEVSGVYGVYDIIGKIRSDSMDRLRETITWHVRRIDKVRSTLTMIVIEGQGEKQK